MSSFEIDYSPDAYKQKQKVETAFPDQTYSKEKPDLGWDAYYKNPPERPPSERDIEMDRQRQEMIDDPNSEYNVNLRKILAEHEAKQNKGKKT